MSSGNAAATKAAVAKAEAALTAMGYLATAAEPRAAARRLNITDHDFILGRLAWVVRLTGSALNHEANMARWCFQESGGEMADRAADIGRQLNRPAGKVFNGTPLISGARSEVTADVRRLGRDTAAARSSFTGLPRSADRAEVDLRQLEEAFRPGGPVHYGVRLAGHAHIAACFCRILGRLAAVLTHEAVLLGGAYEEAGLGRRAGRVAGPVDRCGRDVRVAHRWIASASATLADDAAVMASRTRKAVPA